jgi:hypothetical protein
MAQLHVRRGTRIGALFLISRSTFSFTRQCRWASAVWRPATNALPTAFLLASFVANGSAFLAFSILPERRGTRTTRHGQKSIYHLAGIAEGVETIVFMAAFCLFPTHFPILALIFAAL